MMDHVPLFSALLLAVTACAPVPPPAGAAGWPTAPALSENDYILRDVAALGLTGAEMLPESAASIRDKLGSSETPEGAYAETLAVYEDGARGAVVFTMDNLPDDSVQTEQHVVEFDLRPDGQVEGRVFAMPSGYGLRQKCRRGDDPGTWTKQPCP